MTNEELEAKLNALANRVAKLEPPQKKLVLGASGSNGRLTLHDVGGNQTVGLFGKPASLELGFKEPGASGKAILRNSGGKNTVLLEGQTGSIKLNDKAGNPTIGLLGKGASIELGGKHSTPAGEAEAGIDGHVRVKDSSGNIRIHLDGKTGDITFGGGSGDLSEDFSLVPGVGVEPGQLMVLGEGGGLQQSSQEYDRRVVGVVAGAGNFRPALVLDRSNATHRCPIAMVGKVACFATAEEEAIEPGDLLTTSDVPGHAMKANDSALASGAVFGKALEPLEGGRGLIPVLISLQ